MRSSRTTSLFWLYTKILVVSLAGVLSFGRLNAQVAPDHASPDAIVSALYAVISGPVGQARDWDRFKGLFAPGAKMMAVSRKNDGTSVLTPLSPDDYITRSGQTLVNMGFTEVELGYEQQRFGEVIHRWSAYEGRIAAKPDAPPLRGVNSIQLVSDGKRWYILTVLWQAESGDLKLPKKLAKKAKPS